MFKTFVVLLSGHASYVCWECYVLSGRGLCDELITRPVESYRLWCVVLCDLEPLWMMRPWPTGWAVVPKIQNKTSYWSGVLLRDYASWQSGFREIRTEAEDRDAYCPSRRLLPASAYRFKHSMHRLIDFRNLIWRCLGIIYRVIQKESAILWEMIVCVILSKNVHTNMGLILNG